MHSLIHTLLLAGALSTAGDLGPPRAGVPHEAPSHYCGLHCVYAAARTLDVKFDFVRIVDAKFLTGPYGSTTDDLIAALQHIGLDGYANGFLTLDHLRLLEQPVILHVRSPAGRTFNHWMLFLGVDENGRIQLYDPPRDVESITTAELLSIWDGVGIIVGKDNLSPPLPVPVSFSTAAFVAASAILIQLLLRWLHGWKLVLVVAGLMSFIAHVCLPTGFLQSSVALDNVRASFHEEEIPHLTLDQAERLINAAECHLVDARTSIAYTDFHLPGAVNVPIDSGYLRLARELSRFDDGTAVVVYCQSDGCSWAEQIARQFIAHRIRNVFVYTGGVNEWQAKKVRQ